MQPPIPPPVPPANSPRKPPPIPVAPGVVPVLPVGLHVKPESVTISYRDTFWGEWRNGLCFALLHPVSPLMLIAAAAVFSVVYPAVFVFFRIESFAVRWVANFAFLVLVNGVINALQIRNAHLAARHESITLSLKELEYNSPEKNRHVQWRNVKIVLDATGYIYFIRLDGVNFVPHAAFTSPAARDLFLETARTLQKSRGATWPAALIAQMASSAP